MTQEQENGEISDEAIEREAIQAEGSAEKPKSERRHRATYATDKRNGGYLIRVQGPTAEKFAGREVPVTLKSGREHNEKLTRLIWTGNDAETGEKVSLYAFAAKPREISDDVSF